MTRINLEVPCRRRQTGTQRPRGIERQHTSDNTITNGSTRLAGLSLTHTYGAANGDRSIRATPNIQPPAPGRGQQYMSVCPHGCCAGARRDLLAIKASAARRRALRGAARAYDASSAPRVGRPRTASTASTTTPPPHHYRWGRHPPTYTQLGRTLARPPTPTLDGGGADTEESRSRKSHRGVKRGS